MSSPNPLNLDIPTRHAAASYGRIEVLEYLVSQGDPRQRRLVFNALSSDRGGTGFQEGT